MRRSSSRAGSGLWLAVCATVWLMYGCDPGSTTEDSAGAGTEAAPESETPAPTILPEMAEALTRDLGWSPDEIESRLALEAHAARVIPQLSAGLDTAFAGAWLDDDGGLVVAITDASVADDVRALGGEPRWVEHSLAELSASKATLDREIVQVDDSIHAWYVDVASNAIVVEAADPGSAQVAHFIANADAPVRVVRSLERPRKLIDVRGGDQFIIDRRTLCSVGFSINGGFVTAGHCGRVGSTTHGGDWVPQGVFRGSIFPTHDMAWVETSWPALPRVNNYAGGTVPVRGRARAAIGASVCRSGRTTGWRCGTVRSFDVTVNYADGPVYGMTGTSACAEGGDSGGPFLAGDQAQGVTSGGSGNCSTGGQTFFQPLAPILSRWGLTLKVEGGGGTDSFVSRMNGKCIDVPFSNFVDGQRLHMWTCNGTGAQRWQEVGGTLRAGGLCMDVAGGNPADGTPIQLAHCSGHVAQQFRYTGAGDLVSVLANKCVDIAGWDPDNGASLIIWPCHGGANQKWDRR